MTLLGRVGDLVRAELHQTVPPHVGLWSLLSWLTVFLLGIEIFSGILLMVYYRPSPEEAYASVRYIMSEIQLGWFIRGVHKWAADLLILTLLVHMLRIFFQRAYWERGLNWGIGLVLLLFTGAFAFTGILLAWDRSSFWSIDAARQIIESVPLLGRIVLELFWGGHELEEGALLRFYVFHVGLLPWFTCALLLAHLFLISRQGLSGTGAWLGSSAHQRTYADLLLDWSLLAWGTLGILIAFAVILTPPLGEQIDPLQPAPAKTVWYFLPAYGLMKLVSAGWGLLLLGLGVLALFCVPLIDRSSKPSGRRWLVKGLGLLILAGVIVSGLWGFWQGGLP
jgi:quinol-cytochrome oxidoreductase complex cytochrome b subunit